MLLKHFSEIIECEDVDLVIEAASQEAARQYAVRILEAGEHLMIMSVGALVDVRLTEKIRSLVKSGKVNVGRQKASVFSSVSATNSLKLKILYDNEALNGFRGAFGFSCLIEEKGILFDTGGDVDTLFFNMQKFRVDPYSNIRIIVLSHEHRDHTGGIQIINYCGKVDVFVPASFSDRFKGWLASHPNVRLCEIQELGEIYEGVFTTGELGQFIKEQSLIVKTVNGLTVVTGCAHPGLENILRAASKLGDIYGVVGGFHSFSRLEALKGMHLIVPCHCTVRKREIFNLYPKTCKKCSAGYTILI